MRRVLPPGEYDRRYRQAVCCAGCHHKPSDVAFCQITLVETNALPLSQATVCRL